VKVPPHNETLTLEIVQMLPNAEIEHLAELLETMLKDAPKALLSFHVSFFRNGTVDPLFHLRSEYAPALIYLNTEQIPLLKAESLKGLTPEDEKLWKSWQTHFD
jgi:hypothetical protein